MAATRSARRRAARRSRPLTACAPPIGVPANGVVAALVTNPAGPQTRGSVSAARWRAWPRSCPTLRALPSLPSFGRGLTLRSYANEVSPDRKTGGPYCATGQVPSNLPDRLALAKCSPESGNRLHCQRPSARFRIERAAHQRNLQGSMESTRHCERNFDWEPIRGLHLGKRAKSSRQKDRRHDCAQPVHRSNLTLALQGPSRHDLAEPACAHDVGDRTRVPWGGERGARVRGNRRNIGLEGDAV